ncbi:uncharacterized protein LOC144657921 [Oculina patagonica]
MKSADAIAPKFQPAESRFPPVNMTSSRFYLPSSTTVPVLPYSPYYGGYVSPDMSFPYPQQDIRVLPSYMGTCYHPAFQGIPHHSTNEEKPTQSYIGLIGKAILSSSQQKLVLGDIYNYILTNYPYFRNKGPGWRNSIRHNLSLNDCFVKMGRSPNGKGHFWAINPINYDDFSRGEYKRKRTSRRNRESITERFIKGNTSGKLDEMKRNDHVSRLTANEMADSVFCGPRSFEKKGFHIETLLYNKCRGERVKNSEKKEATSAFTVVSIINDVFSQQQLRQNSVHQ